MVAIAYCLKLIFQSPEKREKQKKFNRLNPYRTLRDPNATSEELKEMSEYLDAIKNEYSQLPQNERLAVEYTLLLQKYSKPVSFKGWWHWGRNETKRARMHYLLMCALFAVWTLGSWLFLPTYNLTLGVLFFIPYDFVLYLLNTKVWFILFDEDFKKERDQILTKYNLKD